MKKIHGLTAPFILSATLLLPQACRSIAARPEINPDSYAPAAPNRPWRPEQTEDSPQIPRADVSSAEELPVLIRASSAAIGLNDLLDVALNNNPDLKQAWQLARAQADAYGMAFSPYYPHLHLLVQGGYARTMYSSIVPIGDIRLGSVSEGIAMDYPISEFGRRAAKVKTARAELAAINSVFNREIQTIVFTVRQAFYGYAAAQELVRAAKVNVTFAQTDLDAVQEREDRGLATLPDVKFAQEHEARAELDLDDARAQEASQKAALAVALGVSADADLRTQGINALPVPNSLDGTVSDFIAQALRARPDIASAASALRAQEATVAEKAAEFRPELDIGGSYSEATWWLSLHHPDPFAEEYAPDETQPIYSATLAFKWDPFMGFAHLNDYRKAQAQQAAQAEALRSRELAAIGEVWRSYFVFQAMHKKYLDARSLMEAALESYDAHSAAYGHGLNTIVELLDAQRDLAQARYVLIGATADALTADAAVDYAVGAASADAQTSTAGGQRP